MKKLLVFVAALVCVSAGQAHADYVLSINGTANGFNYDFSGTVATTPLTNGTFLITSGYLTAAADSVFAGSTFNVLAAGTAVNVDGIGTNLDHDNVLAPGVNPAFPAPNTGIVAYNGTSYLGFTDGSGPNDFYVFDGKDNGYGWKPLAEGVVTATEATPTPIPAAAYLLGSGLMGLWGLRRKKA